jgi:hypothetical protein
MYAIGSVLKTLDSTKIAELLMNLVLNLAPVKYYLVLLFRWSNALLVLSLLDTCHRVNQARGSLREENPALFAYTKLACCSNSNSRRVL